MSVLSPVEEDSLMTQEEVRKQEEWDLEFQRRKEDLARQQLKSRERRRVVSEKMAELQGRWKGVERRRELRSREGRGNNLSQTVAGNHPANNGTDSNNNNNNVER